MHFVTFFLYPRKTKPEVVSNSHYATKFYSFLLSRRNSQPSAQLAQGQIYATELRTRQNERSFPSIYIYSSSLIPSPMFCALRIPNRKWYQTLTIPQNCIISSLSNKPTFICTACTGSILWQPTGVTAKGTKIFYVYTKISYFLPHLFSAT